MTRKQERNSIGTYEFHHGAALKKKVNVATTANKRPHADPSEECSWCPRENAVNMQSQHVPPMVSSVLSNVCSAMAT